MICVVTTVCGPACDSEVRFYNTDWQQLAKEDFIQLPSVGAFYLPVDTLTDEAYAAIREKADMELVKACLLYTSLAMVGLFIFHSETIIYICIAMIGFGNSNVFSIISVSYTHLDGYKRQLQVFSSMEGGKVQ